MKVGAAVRFYTVSIDIICGDDYAAQVLYDDIIQRLQAGEGIKISLEQPPAVGEIEKR